MENLRNLEKEYILKFNYNLKSNVGIRTYFFKEDDMI